MTGCDHGMAFQSVDVGRRRILALVTAVTAGGLLPALRAAPLTPEGVAAGIVTGTVADPAAAERFGSAYLAAYPGEADPERLMQRLGSALSSAGHWSRGGAEALVAQFDLTVRGEYAHGEVVDVDGWLLSRSEARLYALSVYIPREPAPDRRDLP